jgi:hypothetical protein
VDKRADIWAFGVVLYEMLAGRRLFRGEDISDTLAEVLKVEIDFRALSPSTPASIVRLLRRCLERDPRQRLHDIADARVELDEALREPRVRDGAPASRRAAVSVRSPARSRRGSAGGRRLTPSPRVARLSVARTRAVDRGRVRLVTDGAFGLRRTRAHPHPRPDGDVRALPEARGDRPFFSPTAPDRLHRDRRPVRRSRRRGHP